MSKGMMASGNYHIPMRPNQAFGLCYKGAVTAEESGSETTTFYVSSLAGFGDDYFNSRYYIQILKAGGAAPEAQVRQVSDYVSTTGKFVVGSAFGANVNTADEILVVHESLVMIGRDDTGNAAATTNISADADGSILERLEWIQVALGGEAIQLITAQSVSAAVEENAVIMFSISIGDIDAGAIASASINITGISATMEKSTGGGAFDATGITQPTFSKADGQVYCAYQFLAAQWQVGDMYKLVVTGITATVGGDTAYVPAKVWSNIVFEAEEVKEDVDAIVAGLQVVAGGSTGFEADGTGYTLYKATRNIMAQWGAAGNVFTVDPGASDDTADGLSIDTPKKWTDSAINLCADGAGDVILRLIGSENIDDDDTDPAVVCDVSGLTIKGMGGGNPGQASEQFASIRRRQNATWAAAAGPAVTISKPTTLQDLEIVASAQPGIQIEGEGGAESFSLIERCRFVGWGLMTRAIQFNAGAYVKVKDCYFESLTEGCFLDSTASNNPDYNEFIGNKFIGCTYGIDSDAGITCHNVRVIGNEFRSSSTTTMTYGIRTRNLWDSGIIAYNTFDCPRASAYDQTVETLRSAGLTICGNTYSDGTDESLDRANTLAIRGKVSAQETGFETTIFYANGLTGFGDDYFNDSYYVKIIKATEAISGQIRKVSDYVSATGKFTVSAAFGANVTAADDFILVDELIAQTGAVVLLQNVQSGSKTIGTGATKYLHLDSGTNGAEILGITIKGVVGYDWTLDVYVPAVDAATATQAEDKRDAISYVNTDTEGGLLQGFAMPYDCYLDFTNDSGGDQTITQVTILYRSSSTITATWET